MRPLPRLSTSTLPWFVLAVLLQSASSSRASADACHDGSLLRSSHARNSGVLRGSVEAASDGWILPEGRAPTLRDSVVLANGGSLRFDLSRPSAAVAVYVQGDARARFDVLFVDDAGQSERVFEAGPVEGGGQRGRGIVFPTRRVRSVRVVAHRPEGATLSEVGVFACPEALADSARWTRMRPDPDAARSHTRSVGIGKIAFGLFALFLLCRVAPSLAPKRARLLHLTLCLASLLAWLDFGTFVRHPRGPLHTWDSMHYFLGSRYAAETGYTRLYDCIAESARRRGLGAWLERGVIRRLDDDVRVPGTHARSDAARCDVLSPARSAALDADLVRLAAIRMPYGLRPESIIQDRGYLATPFGSAWLRISTAHAPPTVRYFVGMAVLDALLLAGSVLALALGIGLRPASFAAVALGVGMPWDYEWMGGALDRHSWLFALAIALVALHRRWPIVAGLSLAFAVLHRVFPVGFALGALACVGAGAWHRRSLSRFDLRLFAAFGLGLLGGGILGALATTPDAWWTFFSRIPLHRLTHVANELGGPAALRLFGGDLDASIDPGQLDALVPWQLRLRSLDAERLPLRLLAFAACAYAMVRALRAQRSPLEGAFLGALMLATLTNVASYYGAFLMLAAAVPTLSGRGRAALVLGSLSTQLAMLPTFSGTDRFACVSLALLGSLAFALSDVSDPPSRPEAPGSDLT